MSHISKIELVIQSLEDLKEACRQLGFEFMENQKTYKWFGCGSFSTTTVNSCKQFVLPSNRQITLLDYFKMSAFGSRKRSISRRYDAPSV
jgi:hypothetical protein